jgi:4-hydroxy-3-methylbut-2-enyl diphosphate reductase
MKVLMASPRGFCAGVDRAIEVVEQVLEIFGAPVYVRHEIVHNDFVVADLRSKGAIFTDDLNDVPEGSVLIFSAHGVSPAVREHAKQRSLRVIDATCPLVTKIHLEVHKFLNRGFGIFYIGHHGHVETEGTLGEAPGQLRLVTNIDEAHTVEPPFGEKLIYLTQTTLSIDDTAEIVRILKSRFPRLVDPPTGDICYATQNRQDAIKAIATLSDIVLVIGSTTSSNTRSLCRVAESLGTKSYLISSVSDLADINFTGVRSVGVTSGASAPEEQVRMVLDELNRLGASDLEEITVRDEDVAFILPKELLALSRKLPVVATV